MIQPKVTSLVFLIVGLALIAPVVTAQQDKQSEREAMYNRYLEFASYVKGGSIEPHWMADGSSFWYAEGAPENTVIWKVDPANGGTKTPLFDTARLRKVLTPLLGHEPAYQGLPFQEFTFVDKSEKAVKFSVEGKEFILQLDTYEITRAPALSEEEKNRLRPQGDEVPSPDGRWLAGVKDHNLWLRSTYDGRRVQLTTDGVEAYGWGFEDYWAWASAKGASWSPDSFKVAVRRLDYRQVPKIPLVHWLQPIEQVEWHPVSSIFSTTKAGMALPQTELVIIDILSKRQVRVDAGATPDLHLYILGWRLDGSELLFGRVDREFKKLDLLAADPATGATRVVLAESQKTFMENIVLGWEFQEMFLPLRDGQRFIWLSERDGWRYLYLYNFDGTLIRRLTKGAFPVEIWPTSLTVDEKAGWVYFTARGDAQRPYDTHLYRETLEGEGFTRLTEATGQHAIQFAPSREFFLDTHSSTDRPSVVELRGADGRLLQTLSKADITALKDLKWSPPEQFVVKAADGKTDLYGVLYKPHDFDLDKKYPVIESIYGCPQGINVPHRFADWSGIGPQALAQLGFVTFVVDARGTPGRGKRFLDVVYGNLGRFEVPDHVAVLRQLAAKRPYMDLERVGITGGSCGGYFTVRALLLAPDVYRVGVAVATWDPQFANATEVWMGLPQDNKEAYEYASNLSLARNLQGKLLLIHGTSDTAAPFSNIMKLVEAFIRAGKPYDLIVLPDQGHSNEFTGTSAKYAQEALRRYFQEHLKP